MIDFARALSAENEALRERAYQLAYAITGGEDAPGLLESIPTDDLSAMIRSERAGHRDYEHSLRAQVETARADGRNEALDEAAAAMEPILRSMISRGAACRIILNLKAQEPSE